MRLPCSTVPILVLALGVGARAGAQGAAPALAAKPAALAHVLPVDRQIAAAVSVAPADLRAGATVIGYDADGHSATLRTGTNELVCLSDDPVEQEYHVACYHKDLEPFMARGRELRLQHKSRAAIDSIRLADVASKRYAMPSHPSAMYQYFASRDSVDATGAVRGASYLYVVYIPYATPATTGLTTKPISGGPWIMFPGKPWAHIMISAQKSGSVTPQ